MADKEKFRFLGYDKVYDVIQIMLMQFNSKEEIFRRYVLNDELYDDKERVNYLLEKFDIGLDRTLAFLFDGISMNPSFFSKYYTNQLYRYGFMEFMDFIRIIDEDSELQQKILKYHLGDELSEKEDLAHVILFELPEEFSAEKKEELIKILLYFSEIKKILMNELIRVGTVLDGEYEKNKDIIKKIQKGVSNIQYCDEETECWFEEKENIDVRFSYINQYLIWLGEAKTKGGIILGIEYERMFKSRWNMTVSLPKFCEALGDEIRNNILICIKKSKGMSVAEIASTLGLSIQMATYHINKLKETRVICKGKKQNTSKYYINTKSIKQAVKELQFFLEDE